MQRSNTTTLVSNTPQPVRQLLRGVLPILGTLAILMAFPPAARALDFDPETVQVSELFPEDSYVNPRDFGAIGDGETDDTAAILAAIDAIIANGEGVLVLENGEFYCPSWPEDGLRITVPIAIQGKDAVLRGNRTARLFDMVRQFLIENLHIEQWRGGVEFHAVGAVNHYDKSDWAIIRGNSFESVNHPMQAYRSGSFRDALSDATDPHRMSLVLISRNSINNARSGITIAAIHVEDIIISQNTIENILRTDYESDPDELFTILSAIRIGMDGENMENGQKISNVNILDNVIRNIQNNDPVRDRAYGILNYRGPDRIAGNWFQNFRATTGRVMGIYSRSASNAITENNVLIDVSSDSTDTPTPSRGAISSKKPRHLNHLVRGNTIIFTDAYKNETGFEHYTGMLMGNQNVEYRNNLLIGCVGGGINTWRLGSNETSFDVNLVFDGNILINCSGDAFSNYFGRTDLLVTNNTLIRHDGALYHHGSFSDSEPVERVIIEGNSLFEHSSGSSVIKSTGSGLMTGTIEIRNNFYEHIDALNSDTFGPLDGGGGLMGTWTSDWLNENSVIRIEGNRLIGFRRSSNADIDPNYILRLYAKIREVSISGNYFKYGNRLFNPAQGSLPDILNMRNNHIEDYANAIYFAGRGTPEDHEWDAITLDLTSNTGDFPAEEIGNYELSAVSGEAQQEYYEPQSIDSVAEQLAGIVANLQDAEIRSYLETELEFLIGSISAPEDNLDDDWTFNAPGRWVR